MAEYFAVFHDMGSSKTGTNRTPFLVSSRGSADRRRCLHQGVLRSAFRRRRAGTLPIALRIAGGSIRRGDKKMAFARSTTRVTA